MSRIFTLFALALVLGACGLPSAPDSAETPRFRITGVTVRPLDRASANGMTNFFYSDTLRAQIAFEVRTHARRLDAGAERAVTSASADDPLPGIIVNPTVPSASWLSFDQPVRHRGTEIPAHTNLLAVDRIAQSFDGSRLDLSFPQLSPFAIGQIHLRQEMFEFTPGVHRMALRWQTAEGETFADTVQVYLRVGNAS